MAPQLPFSAAYKHGNNFHRTSLPCFSHPPERPSVYIATIRVVLNIVAAGLHCIAVGQVIKLPADAMAVDINWKDALNALRQVLQVFIPIIPWLSCVSLQLPWEGSGQFILMAMMAAAFVSGLVSVDISHGMGQRIHARGQ